jgi:hypothetical protein
MTKDKGSNMQAIPESQSKLMMQIVIGKVLGLLIGLSGFFMVPLFLIDVGPMFQYGILLWYITFGAIIGLMAQVTYHPLFKSPMPWWLGAGLMGAWLNFMLTFFAFDIMETIMLQVFGQDGIIQSPFWFTAEGLILGLLIGFGVKYLADLVPLPTVHLSE